MKMAWLIAHWVQVVVAILAVDAALIPLFPQVQLLVKIKDVLTSVAPKSS
jgi:hypothetical protein